ncbi:MULTISPECIES: GNAT family N-acetyltransferase [Haloferax]|uniref:GNAT family N-acetyltransferase n=2 Tax=Haloferax TaxID=2251 RepID=A0A6G1Z1A6_9EURY|nr:MULTISPECIES: GNAT family N-acetyltransferase [Haloferax]KAB1187661.1 GNAT family N-acetyltransferase [Haloferax sp. CBA1149]MRW80320.1 GNAT family N-acetyltransferase [Haloferax marinisediminis]
MQIRPCSDADIASLVDDLWLPFAEEMGGIDQYDALATDVDVRTEAVEYRRAQLADEDTETFVAVDDEGRRLVGYTTVSYAESPPVFARGPVAKVKDLYVAPAARGDGLGTRLLERAHEWGRERGCERVALSVHARNEGARACYESMGYETRYLKMDRSL